MQVTEVRLTKANTEDNCLAYGSVTFDGDFVVCGIRVLQNNKNGDLFVGFPSRKNQKGEYNLYDIEVDHDQVTVKLAHHGYAHEYQRIIVELADRKVVFNYCEGEYTEA